MKFTFRHYISIYVFLCSFVFSQKENIFGSVSVLVASPQGQFSEFVSNNAYGLDLDGGWNFNNTPFSIGMNFSFGTYGKLKRKIPFNYFSDLISLTETTESDIMMINPYVKMSLDFAKSFSLHMKGFGGYQILKTSSTIKNDDQEYYNDDSGNEKPYIAKSDVFEDGAFSYGYGIGIRFPIPFINNKYQNLLMNIEFKWSTGGEAEYLNAGKEGSIIFSDSSNGPVTTKLNPDRSKTDLFNISIGIGI